MIYEDKVIHAHRLIASVLAHAKNPCVMCSFGKDSIVVLHMVMRHKKLKVIFHREPFQHHKYDYANMVIKDWDLFIVDYPPSATTWLQAGDEVEIVNHYQAGNKSVYLPTGLRQNWGGDRICAYDDIYGKPTGTFNYPFDMCFHGHKSVDSDFSFGKVPLNSDIAFNVGCASAVFPIRHFTNEDVWRYIEENNLPIHHERYEKVDGTWVEKEDKTNNPDYIDCCFSCMNEKNGPSVYCPKVGFHVSSIVSQLRPTQRPNLEYLKS